MRNLNTYIFATNFVALIAKDLNGTLVRELKDGTYYLDKDCFNQFISEKDKTQNVFQLVCSIVHALTQQDELDIVRDGLVVVDTVVWNEDGFIYEYYDR